MLEVISVLLFLQNVCVSTLNFGPQNHYFKYFAFSNIIRSGRRFQLSFGTPFSLKQFIQVGALETLTKRSLMKIAAAIVNLL